MVGHKSAAPRQVGTLEPSLTDAGLLVLAARLVSSLYAE